MLKTYFLQIAVISSYIDFDDYENLLCFYLQDINIIGMVSTLSFKSKYKVRMNRANMSDSLWLGSQRSQNQFEFYSIEKGNDFLTSIDYDNIFFSNSLRIRFSRGSIPKNCL